jgi:hypothetical protein
MKVCGRLGLQSGFKESKKASTLLQRDFKGMNNYGINVVVETANGCKEQVIGRKAQPDETYKRQYEISKDEKAKTKIRRLTPIECERLQTIDDNSNGTKCSGMDGQ